MKTVEYQHNALGNRVAKLIDGEVTEKYLWQNKTTLLAIYDKDDNLKQRFEYTLGHVPTSFTQNNQRYYILTDQIGSPKLIADENGNTVKQLDYDSFGNLITDSNPDFAIPFGFAGGLHDNDTGLIRFGYRDYDPETGRWTARDPIGFAGGDTNLYGYVLGDPVNWVDLTGEIPVAPLIYIGVVSLGIYVLGDIAQTGMEGIVAEREHIIAEQTGIGETLSPEALAEAQDKAETLKLVEPMSQLVNTMPKSFDAIKYIYAQIAKWFGAEAADLFLELLDKEKEEDDGCP